MNPILMFVVVASTWVLIWQMTNRWWANIGYLTGERYDLELRVWWHWLMQPRYEDITCWHYQQKISKMGEEYELMRTVIFMVIYNLKCTCRLNCKLKLDVYTPSYSLVLLLHMLSLSVPLFWPTQLLSLGPFAPLFLSILAVMHTYMKSILTIFFGFQFQATKLIQS